MAGAGRALSPPLGDAADLRVDGVHLDTRLESFTFGVSRGERLVLLGRNGAGKTTLLRLAAGLESPDRGRITTEKPIAYVPQSFGPSLLPWFRIERNITLGMRGDARRTREAIDRVLGIVPLAREHLARFPYQLSGGEQQLVVLARALVTTPRVLLLDEPFSALDLATRVRVCDAIAKECERTHGTAVLVTHDLDDAVAFATRAVVLAGRPARIAYDGPISDSVREKIESLMLEDARGATS